jgi:hypothetical protein
LFLGTVTIKRDYDDGSVRHARLQLGESMIMLNEANSDYEVNKSQMHVYEMDVEKTYELALTNYAKSLMSPKVRPHGDLMAGFKTHLAMCAGSLQRCDLRTIPDHTLSVNCGLSKHHIKAECSIRLS